MRPKIQELSPRQLRQTLEAQAGQTPEASSSLTPETLTSPTTVLQTTTPGSLPTAQPAHTPGSNLENGHYLAQSGDTLPALAGRFGVSLQEISSSLPIPEKTMIPAGQELAIANWVQGSSAAEPVLPDSEVVNSPTTLDFDIAGTINQAGGYLSQYSELVQAKRISGAEIVQRVALESSVNPRFLLALIELRSGWLRGAPAGAAREKYPIGFHVGGWEGLYKELVISATHLNAGYYGWREGSLTQLQFIDGRSAPTDPELNAGSIATQYLLAKLYPQDKWQAAVYGAQGITGIYQQLFGDPWSRAARLGPLFPDGLSQPELELPFHPGERWSLTGGPHPSWKTGSPRGALDLAPVSGEMQCAMSRWWVLASAGGLIARSERNVVTIDLDGDGHEQTGWVILYMHVADKDRIAAGVTVKTNDPLGHASCEGGTSTGTHVHIARKYNGEWIAADGPLPFVLSGWQAFAGQKVYLGGMTKGSQQVVASPVGPRTSIIIR